jgi:hypothetical protein
MIVAAGGRLEGTQDVSLRNDSIERAVESGDQEHLLTLLLRKEPQRFHHVATARNPGTVTIEDFDNRGVIRLSGGTLLSFQTATVCIGRPFSETG